jgi:hypothetical protein
MQSLPEEDHRRDIAILARIVARDGTAVGATARDLALHLARANPPGRRCGVP